MSEKKRGNVGIKEDYFKAQKLLKAGQLIEAKALLTSIDHPKAKELLLKVNQAIGVSKSRQDKSEDVPNKRLQSIAWTIASFGSLLW